MYAMNRKMRLRISMTSGDLPSLQSYKDTQIREAMFYWLELIISTLEIVSTK